jgi:hypothetical protein
MKIKQKIKQLLIGAFLVIGLSLATVASSTITSADCTTTSTTNCCGGVQTAIIHCDQTGGSTKGDVSNTGIWGILLLAINILSAGVGIAAVGGLVYGSILYTSAGGSPEQVKKAIGVITNVVIGIIAYALMFGALNFLIPGGLFN